MDVNRVKRIAVLGAGVMGHGIAQVSASAGYQVVVRDISQEFLDKGREAIKSSLGRFVKRERLSQSQADEILGRIRFTTSLDEAVSNANLVIEAVPEIMDLKRRVWAEVDELAPRDAILATNTSSLSITEMARHVSHPERFLGMHFFNPPVLMKLVEVNQGEQTSPEVVNTVMEIARRMRKTPVWVRKDSPGFIVNRVLITYLNEAAKLLDQYSVRQIDSAMQHRAGMPLGPFMLCDLIGLDIVVNILRTFESKWGEYYTPDGRLLELVKSGKLGRKTGEGFYKYDVRPSVKEEEGEGFDVQLLLKPFVAEAEKLLEEGVASKEDIETAVKLGCNLAWGPFEIKEKGFNLGEDVIAEKQKGVLWITLNRPSKLNSLTLDMLDQISTLLAKAEKDSEVKVIAFKGAGDRAFCAGADVSQFPSLTKSGAQKLSEKGHNVFKQIINCSKPTIAVIHGYCLGGGNELAMACDYRLASEAASFGQPEITLGLIPGWGGTYLLPKLIGPARALELISTGRRISAKEAEKIGLVTKVFEASEFNEKVEEFISNIARGPPLALKSVKQLLKGKELEEAFKMETEEFSKLFETEDTKEGLKAFNERRKPAFKGL